MIKQKINNILEALKLKRYEISKEDIKKLIIKEDPLILEIGCNNGTDTLEFLNTFSKANIHCFEPDPRAIEKFKEKINEERCKLWELAISNIDGETSFHLSGGKDPYGKMDDWDQSSSIKNPKKHLEKFPWCKFDKEIKVKTRRLDTWAENNMIGNIDFIWADVQGAERELIEGGLKVLNNTNYLYIEFYDEEMYEGQLNLKDMLCLLPQFEIVKKFGNNVLLKNKVYKE